MKTDGFGLPLTVILFAGNLAKLPLQLAVVPAPPTNKSPAALIATPYGALKLWLQRPGILAGLKTTAGVMFCDSPDGLI